MLALILALAAAGSDPPPSAAPPAFGKEDAYAAIWNDAQLNAMIGNGNPQVSWAWYLGLDREHPPVRRITRLRCRPLRDQHVCTFDFRRTPHPASTNPEDLRQTRRLACRAIFYFSREEARWVVLHYPPDPHGVHTRTSLACG